MKPFDAVKSLNGTFQEAKGLLAVSESGRDLSNMQWKVTVMGAILVGAGTWGVVTSVDSINDVVRSEDSTVYLDDVFIAGLSPVILPASGLAIYGGAEFAGLAGIMKRRRRELG